MRNQAFSHSSLARCFYPADFYADAKLGNDEAYRKKVVDEALCIANSHFQTGMRVSKFRLGKKDAYATSALAEKLVHRKCVANIFSCIRVPTKQRNTIAQELKCYLEEGTGYRIYKLDISKFFESTNIGDVKAILDELSGLSIHTKNIINGYLRHFNSNFGGGIPRGIEISPVLSNLILSKFDNSVKEHEEVVYYTRFVDDIIITTSTEDKKAFYKWLCAKLPGKLRFNYNKKYIEKVNVRGKSSDEPNGTEVACFDFLGYSYSVVDSQVAKNAEKAIRRKVKIDLSNGKVKKIQTKITRALVSYHKNVDYDLLFDRINFLVTNRDLFQKAKGRFIPTGIYYNYSKIDEDSENIKKLDCFLKRMILCAERRFGHFAGVALSSGEKKALLKLSFSHGFKKRVFKRYSPSRLKEITKIWL